MLILNRRKCLDGPMPRGMNIPPRHFLFRKRANFGMWHVRRSEPMNQGSAGVLQTIVERRLKKIQGQMLDAPK